MSPIRASERSRYPTDWSAISQRIRFERANGQCECDGRCGSKRHQPCGERCPAMHGHSHPTTGSKVILTTAHLDHTPENCDDDNLMAMCQACHLAYDADHHRETRLTAKDGAA